MESEQQCLLKIGCDSLVKNNNIFIANIISLVILLLVALFITSMFSPLADKTRNCLIAAGITFGLFPLASHVWNMEASKGYSVVDWIKSLGLAFAIIGVLFIGDALLGKLFYPDLPFYVAAMKHVGFVVTLFVTPVLPVAILCTLRAIILQMLNKTEKSLY